MALPSSFINRDLVVRKLIKERCKLADKRSERDRTIEFIRKSDCSSRQFLSGNERLLTKLFPPRSKWCHIGKRRTQLDAISRNERRLWYTYLKAKSESDSEEWYKELCAYADRITRMALNQMGGIPAPRVTAIEKKAEDKVMTCRPICTFGLELKIIFSLLNRYLTTAFDPYFEDCSYAFRVVKKGQHTLLHLNAVERIREYRKAHLGIPLYVAECDMMKFYDTIDHEVIKKRFSGFLQAAKRDGFIPHSIYRVAKRWVYFYVECFNFGEHVWKYNEQPSSDSVWQNIKRREQYTCRFGWIEKSLSEENVKHLIRKRVGVPQGGALSGLIANVVMHTVDKDVIKSIGNHDILYSRFCDDMLLLGSNHSQVKDVLDVYNNSVERSFLFPHPSKAITHGPMKEFWEGKTRGPYEWGEKGKHVYPWITFVGFDVNWNGNLRIRLSSYKRQIKKQNELANEIFSLFVHGKRPRFIASTMMSSLVNRLINTSVGRVSLWNYKHHLNKQSWMAAFSILDENPWSVKQLKELDRHRHLVIGRAMTKVMSMECGVRRKYESSPRHISRFSYYGCPYSYYGQCFKYIKR